MAYLGREAAKAPLVTADIPDDSITAAKIVDATIAAGDLAANSVDSSELVDGSIDTSHIADDQVTLAKMAGGTDGQIITYDASGDPVAVGPGTDGQVLTSTGAGSPPAFEDAAASGQSMKIIVASLVGSAMEDDDTFTFDFGASPNALDTVSQIHLTAEGKTKHTTSGYQGMSTSECLIDITGTDTFTSLLNITSLVAHSASTVGSPEREMGITDRVFKFFGGHDGSTYASQTATGAWVTSSRQFTITFGEATSLQTAYSWCRLCATAISG